MRRKLIAITIAAPIIVGLAMLLYTWPSARSKPRDVPIAVVAPATRIDAVAGKLRGAGGLDPRRYSDADAAERAVRHRDVDGALMELPSGVRVLVASAAGPALSMQLQPKLIGIAGPKATARDVVPTPKTDPQGNVVGEGVLPLTLAGQLSAITLALATPLARQQALLKATAAMATRSSDDRHEALVADRSGLGSAADMLTAESVPDVEWLHDTTADR